MEVLREEHGWYAIQHGRVHGYVRADLMRVYDDDITDLDKEAYFAPYVRWAFLTGISQSADGRFRASDNISREDMCTLLYNYVKLSGRRLTSVNGKAAFTDDSGISAYASTGVYALQQAGVINGMGDGTFGPKGTATRAQVAQIFMKFMTA